MKTKIILCAFTSLFLIASCNNEEKPKPPTTEDVEKGIYMTLITEKAKGEKINLKINSDADNKKNVWIDLNVNGKKDEGEAVANFAKNVEYIISSKIIKVYGKVTEFHCADNKLISLDVSKNEFLKYLDIHKNKIKAVAEMDKLIKGMRKCYENAKGTFIVVNEQDSKENKITAKQVEVIKGKNWEVWDSKNKPYAGEEDTPIPDPVDKTPYIALTTKKAKIQDINIHVMAEDADKGDIWIDLNNNGIKDAGEAVTGFVYYKTYTVDSQYIRIYGKVTYLDVRYGEITSLDASNNPGLKSLGCSDNLLTSLDLSKNKSLVTLFINNNELVNLDVSNNTDLKNLFINNNQLIYLDLSKNKSLEELGIHKNKLTNLYVSNNKALKELYCNFNELINLDVSNNISLERLTCFNNKLTNLDVSNNIDLIELRCNNNELTKLDVSNNIGLKDLYCNDNQLIYLDVSNNTSLKELFCNNNKLSSFGVSKNNVLLEYIKIFGNQITDTIEMGKIVNDMPTHDVNITLGKFRVVETQTSKENKITKAQVKALRNKNWRVRDDNNNDYLGE